MNMAVSVCAGALMLGAHINPVSAQSSPLRSIPLSAEEHVTLQAMRKQVWVDWFSGNTDGLRGVLSPKLVAISPDGWQSLDESIAGSVAFKNTGGRLMSVTFDHEVIHHFGDVVVMFSVYTLVTETQQKRAIQTGRATEVFVKSKGHWVHTSWHLDRFDGTPP